MFHSYNEHIKLIDFGFATKFETNEIRKKLTIEGTISFGSLKFLEFYSKFPFDSFLNPEYEYERTFDLYCSLNVIIIMTNNHLKTEFYEIKNKQIEKTHQNIILAMHKFWFDLKVRNKDYSKLLKLFDNLKEPKDFQSIENILKELVNWDD
jgi:serine/threonine protein kinase